MARPKAFTLIEMLITISVLTILGAAFLTVVTMVIREEANERVQSTLRQEGLSVVRAILRDAHVASKVEVLREPVSPPREQANPIREPSSSGLGASAKSESSSTQRLMLIGNASTKLWDGLATRQGPAERRITYQVVGSRMERVVAEDAHSSPVVQVLAENIKAWRIEPGEKLLRIHLAIGQDRYARQFAKLYEFAIPAR